MHVNFSVCEVSTIPDVENGVVTVDAYNTTIASYADVTCNDSFAATAPTILCMGAGVWQNNVSCVRFGKRLFIQFLFNLFYCLVILPSTGLYVYNH